MIDTTSTLRKSVQLERGKAAEYFVCADLLLQGRTTFPSDQGLPYDVVVDTGSRLLKIQVKSTLKPKITHAARKTAAYFYYVRRAGRGGRRIYRDDEFDMFALVALDTGHIGYIATCDAPKQYIAIRVPGDDSGVTHIKAREFGECTFNSALERVLESKIAEGR